MEHKYFSMTQQEVLSRLNSDPNGLSENERKKRLAKYGRNEFAQKKTNKNLAILARQLKNAMVYILAAAATLSLFFGDFLDFLIISLLLGINIIFGFIQERKAENSLEKLKVYIKHQTKVLIEGQIYEKDASEIVVGDIILLSEGDRVPADARLLEGSSLQVNESLLTGESLPQTKRELVLDADVQIQDQTSMVFMGTLVVAGNAKAVVVKTALQTELGKIASTLSQIKKEKIHFDDKIKELTKQMSLLAIVTAVSTFTIGYFVRGFELKQITLFTVSALVSSIPEGLPVILTIIVAISAKRLSEKNALVRKLSATETLSVVDTIISDKTGTITKGEMQAEYLYFPDAKNQLKTKDALTANNKRNDILTAIALHCNSIKKIKNDKIEELKGEPTEIAVYNITEYKLPDKKYKLLHDYGFIQSKRLRATSIISNKTKQTFILGAIEALVENSSHYVSENGTKVKWKKTDKTRYLANINEEFLKKGMRLIAAGYKDVKDIDTTKPDTQNINFVSAIALYDPPRKEAQSAISSAKKAGINVIMATGDHPITALSIALEVGLVTDSEEVVLTAKDIIETSESELWNKVKDVNIFARMTPEAKLKLARVFQAHGKTVAMTGDGVNDAPSLKGADIGISMGLGGTDVAREASDIILTDNNFATIINAIKEGRTQFRNIKRTSYFLVTTNITESLVLVISLIANFPLPLLPVHILWLNVIGSGITDIALATESVKEDVLSQPPRKKEEKIINRNSIPLISAISLTTVLLSLIVFYLNKDTNIQKAQTLLFVLISLSQLWSMLILRSIKTPLYVIGIFGNKNVNKALVLSLVLLASTVYVPFLRNTLKFTHLTVMEIGGVFMLSILVFFVGELVKLVRTDKNISTSFS